MRTARHQRGRVAVTLPVFSGAVGLAISLVPTLLPRPLLIQAIFSAVVLVQSYALGVLARAIGRATCRRFARTRRARRQVGATQPTAVRRLRAVGPIAVTGAALAAGVAVGTTRSSELLRHMGQPAPSPFTLPAAAGIAIGLGAAALLTCAGVARLARRLPRSRRGRAALLVPLLTVSTWAAPLPAGALPPAGLQTSTASSTVLGPKGRQFLTGAPSAASIERVTGRPATTPLRLYVGLDSADGPQARARLAVHELERSGAFGRAAIVLAMPTGSGWVDPAGIGAIEYLYGGDIASVAVQYASTPSWIAYLSGTRQARRSARALVDAVHQRVSALPAGQRPKVLIFGESLGALAALTAQPTGDLVQHTDGALWVGVPAPARSAARSAAAASNRQQVLIHSEDPVAAWSPDLMVERTAYWPGLWLPGISFWQAVADLAAAYSTPTGFGHRYGSAMVDAWWIAAAPDARGTPAPGRLTDVRDAVRSLTSVG